MRLRLLAVGTRMPAWVQAGFRDYEARLPPVLRFELQEVAPAARSGKGGDSARYRREEGERLLRALRSDDYVIALDERGEKLDSMQWAEALGGWLQAGRDVVLLIGGPDGLAPEVLQRAARRWSLSALTLPHGLVRVLVAEQLFRAWSLLGNHPYHRA